MTVSINECVLAEARRWIGTPYVHQASTRGAGCDCLGLARGVWRAVIGHEPEQMPAYSRDWGEVGRDEHVLGFARRHLCEIASGSTLPGDLIVFRWRAGNIAKHMGFLAEEGRFIHAWERVGVVEAALSPSWRKRIAAFFRFPDEARKPL